MSLESGIRVTGLFAVKERGFINNLIPPAEFTYVVQPKPYNYDNKHHLLLECEYLVKVKHLLYLEREMKVNSALKEQWNNGQSWYIELHVLSTFDLSRNIQLELM